MPFLDWLSGFVEQLLGRQAASCVVTISPESGTLGPNEKQELRVVMTTTTKVSVLANYSIHKTRRAWLLLFGWTSWFSFTVVSCSEPHCVFTAVYFFYVVSLIFDDEFY